MFKFKTKSWIFTVIIKKEKIKSVEKNTKWGLFIYLFVMKI